MKDVDQEGSETDAKGDESAKSELASTQQEHDEESPDIQEILEKLDPSERDFILTLAKSEHYSGPLPHPSHLKDYAEIYPDAPEIIFNMAEQQQQHRHFMERENMKNSSLF